MPTVTALRVQVRRARELARLRGEEEQQLVGQLDRAARLETVGRVAGGVALRALTTGSFR